MKKLLRLSIFPILCCMVACQDISMTDAKAESAGIHRFNGTIYEYIAQGDPALGFTYDSLKVLLNLETDEFKKLTNVKDLLNDASQKYTFFAAPDPCFEEACKGWKLIRRGNGLDEHFSLQEVFDYHKEVEIDNPDKTDRDHPTITLVHDYKNSLDTLINRYVFSGLYDFETIYAQEDATVLATSLTYSYRMNMNCGYNNASGVKSAGIPYLTFSDTRKTYMKERWKNAEVYWMDIYCTNGVVHVLSPGHEFGFGYLISQLKNYGNE